MVINEICKRIASVRVFLLRPMIFTRVLFSWVLFFVLLVSMEFLAFHTTNGCRNNDPRVPDDRPLLPMLKSYCENGTCIVYVLRHTVQRLQKYNNLPVARYPRP